MIITATVVSKSGWIEASSDRQWTMAKCVVDGGQYGGKVVDVYYSRVFKREVVPAFEVGSKLRLELKLDNIGNLKGASIVRRFHRPRT